MSLTASGRPTIDITWPPDESLKIHVEANTPAGNQRAREYEASGQDAASREPDINPPPSRTNRPS